MSAPSTSKRSPRVQAMVDLIEARDSQIAAVRTGQLILTFDLGLSEVSLKIQEVCQPVKIAQ